MSVLRIHSNLGDYDAVFEADSSYLAALGREANYALLVDRNVHRLHAGRIAGVFDADKTLLLDAVEDNKNLDKVVEIYDYLTRRQAKKNLTLISIGGGITQDVTGFVASTLYRGVRWIFVPTTLLAQTDSCIGSKTSLNFRSFKNLIGTFYPPTRVHVDAAFLGTLSELDFYSGLGEIVKLQLMKEDYPKRIDAVIEAVNRGKRDAAFILELVRDSLNVKIAYMANDEFDRGRRNLLNYGHCFGHAIETASGYYVPHGIAVNVGMIFANALSVRRGLLDEGTFRKVTEELNVCNIPLKLRADDFAPDALLSCLKNDKKRTGKNLTVVIPDRAFKLIKVSDVTEEEFNGTLDQLRGILFS